MTLSLITEVRPSISILASTAPAGNIRRKSPGIKAVITAFTAFPFFHSQSTVAPPRTCEK